MRISPIIRLMALGIALCAIGAGGWITYRATLSDVAYVFNQDIPQYTFIDNSDTYLTRVSVPRDRDFMVIDDPTQIVGKYTSQAVYATQLVQEPHLLEALPDGRRPFAYGLLPENTRAYPLEIPDPTLAQLVQAESDWVDIYILFDEDGFPNGDDKLILLFQKARALEATESHLVVGLDVRQIAAYEGWKAVEGVSFTAGISQEANGDYTPLYQADLYPNYDDPAILDLFAAPQPEEALVSEEVEE